MRHSIRWRLVVSFVFVALLIVGLSGLLAIWGIGQYARNQEAQYLTVNAQVIANQAQPFLSPVVFPDKLQQLAQTAAFLSNANVRILDSQHKVIVDVGQSSQSGSGAWLVFQEDAAPSTQPTEIGSRGWVIGVLPITPGITVSLNPQEKPVTIVRRLRNPWGGRFTFETLNNQKARKPGDPATSSNPTNNDQVIIVPVGDQEAPVGYVELVAGLDFANEALRATWQPFFFAGITAIILSAIVGTYMGKRFSIPVTELMETTRQMSAGDLAVRANVRHRDEIGELAKQFNHMAEQLESTIKKLQNERDTLHRFITDASHELRTPITALRNFNELLLGGANDDPQVSAEFLAESKVQIDRLAWITQNLLISSRLEGGLVQLDITPDSVQDLIERTSVPFKLQAEEKGLTLTLDLPEHSIEILCDQRYIETALSNLLDNAVKYTPRGGHILVTAEESHGLVRISVQDDGPGIHPNDLPHIFQRFYRGKNNAATGDGLGLSIVQSIAQAHGWRVRAENIPNGGSKFTLEI